MSIVLGVCQRTPIQVSPATGSTSLSKLRTESPAVAEEWRLKSLLLFMKGGPFQSVSRPHEIRRCELRSPKLLIGTEAELPVPMNWVGAWPLRHDHADDARRVQRPTPVARHRYFAATRAGACRFCGDWVENVGRGNDYIRR